MESKTYNRLVTRLKDVEDKPAVGHQQADVRQRGRREVWT